MVLAIVVVASQKNVCNLIKELKVADLKMV